MKTKRNYLSFSLIALLSIAPLSLAADASVVNGYEGATVIAASPDSNLSQRLTAVERKMTGFEQLHLLQKVNTQQQEIQDLRGQVEVLTYELQQLKIQQQRYYQDLDARILQLGEKSPATVVNSVPAAAVTATTPTTIDADKVVAVAAPAKDAKSSYDAAYQYVQAKDYDTAIRAMQNYVRDYPNSPYTVNAYYWLGELYLTQKQLDKANQQFSKVIQNYPESPKVPDAMLKQAYILTEQKSIPAAKALLTQIISTYPHSAAARLAKNNLANLPAQ